MITINYQIHTQIAKILNQTAEMTQIQTVVVVEIMTQMTMIMTKSQTRIMIIKTEIETQIKVICKKF